jgi:hypothetical protein
MRIRAVSRAAAVAAVVGMLLALWPVSAQARLEAGNPLYDAVAKRLQIPMAPNVEVVERNPPNTIGLSPYWPQLRNLKMLASILRWNEKEPGVNASIFAYKPSENTLGSTASLERLLRSLRLREPASAIGITEAEPGGPRNDVWCPPKDQPKSDAFGVEVVLVDNIPALNFKIWPSGEVPECRI